MTVPAHVEKLYKDFSAEYQKNGSNCDKLCAEIKVELAKLGNQLLLEAQDPKVLALSREVYERGAFLSIKKNDPAAFERHVKQLKIYYRDFDKKIGVKSANEYKILGLYLLSLLANDRIGEFHTELELVTEHDSEFIQRPVMLERYLMEGNYAKINQSLQGFSSQEHYPVFLGQLQDTMRRRILESLGRSTNSVSLDRVSKMLYMKNSDEVKQYITKFQANQQTAMNDDDEASKWEIRGNQLVVGSGQMTAKVGAMESIQNCIDYATQIEKIV